MTHTNIFRFMLPAVGALMLTTACSFEQEDYFDESASLRITHMNDNIKSILVSQSQGANNGWVIQYFVAGTDDYNFEGFNLFGRFFDSGKVTLAGNHRYLRNGNANQYTEASSTYEMLAEEGPVLSFNTWNDVLTVFEDPVNPQAAPTVLSNDGEGMNGDHNLVLRTFSDNELTFRGQRHSANIRFIPCSMPWQDYINAVNELKSKIATSTLTSYYVTNGTDTMYFSGLNRGVFNYCDRVYDPLQNKVVSCVFTPNGFRLQHTDSLGSNRFQEFTVDADSTCLVSEDGSVKVIATWDDYIVDRTDLWRMDESLFSAEQQSLFEQIAAELKSFNRNYVLDGIYMGQSVGANSVTGIVIGFYANATTAKLSTAGIAMPVTRPAFGQMLVEYDPESDSDRNMTNFTNRGLDVEDLLRAFAVTLQGTYTITPNNYFLPTGATFTPVSGGVAFKLDYQE